MGTSKREKPQVMKYNLIAFFLIFLATVKVFADVFDFEKLSALAAITNVAPAMKVFTAHKGYETYSSKFSLKTTHVDGENVEISIDSKTYAGLKGPYNRRNVYGALIAYGPYLTSKSNTKTMWEEMARKTFCGNNSVLSELGDENISGVVLASIKYTSLVNTSPKYANNLSVSCE